MRAEGDSWRRDLGPYQSADQAMRQFGNWSQGMRLPNVTSAAILVAESLYIAGVEASEFERDYLRAHGIDPVLATIVHGWLVRARLQGEATASILVRRGIDTPGGPVDTPDVP